MHLAFSGKKILDLFMNIKTNTLSIVLFGALLAGCTSGESPFGPGGGSSSNIISDINFTVSASETKPEVITADGIRHGGIEVEITARAGDRDNVAVSSGTVYFQSEYGLLSPNSCEMGSTGTCSITWTSLADGLPLDYKASIVGYTLGEESYYDEDDSGNFNDGDTAMTDTDEPFIDANHNGTFDIGIDLPIDLDDSARAGVAGSAYTPADGLLSVSGCTHSSLCASSSRIYIYGRTTLDLDRRSDPTVSITAPAAAGAIGSATEAFTVNAADAEDGTITGLNAPLAGNNIVWESDLMGVFGTNSNNITVDTSGWTGGTHLITVTVTDSDGNTTAATINVTK